MGGIEENIGYEGYEGSSTEVEKFIKNFHERHPESDMKSMTRMTYFRKDGTESNECEIFYGLRSMKTHFNLTAVP